MNQRLCRKIFIFATIFLLHSQLVWGRGEGLLFVTGLVGIGSASIYGAIPTELADWKQPSSESTSRFASQCGLDAEFKIYGNNAYNFLFIGLTNTDAVARKIDFSKIRMDFNTGISRMAASSENYRPVELEPNITQGFWVVFPSKGDFLNADQIKVEIPAEGKDACRLQAGLERNPQEPRNETSSVSSTSFEMSIGLGGRFGESSDFKRLGGEGIAFDFTLYGYLGRHSGAHLSLFGHTLEGADSATRQALTGDATTNPHLTATGLTFGYSFRNEFQKDWQLGADLGLGSVGINHQKSGVRSGESTSHFAIYSKLNLVRRLTRVREGFGRGDYSVVLTAFDLWIPNGSVAGFSAKGHMPGALISFRVGQ